MLDIGRWTLDFMNYEEKIAKQEEVVKTLTEEYKKTPSEELELKLNRETDTLRQLINSSTGDPKERSQETAEVARTVALNRAVQQIE
jgi:hypothetical protein